MYLKRKNLPSVEALEVKIGKINSSFHETAGVYKILNIFTTKIIKGYSFFNSFKFAEKTVNIVRNQLYQYHNIGTAGYVLY